jgi:hypothetical protein
MTITTAFIEGRQTAFSRDAAGNFMEMVAADPGTAFFLNSAAGTNSTLVATGSTGVSSLYATNQGGTVAFLKLYNKATAPVVGTDIPVMIIDLAAATTVPGKHNLTAGMSPFRFPLGLGLAITGGLADSDTTAVAANQVKVAITEVE